MPESMTPLIILGVVGALFILLLSLLTNNYSLNNIKSKTVGDGQYGTARWATDQEIRKAYVTVPFDVASWRAGKKRPTVQGLVLGSVQRGKRLDARRCALPHDRRIWCRQDCVLPVSQHRICLRLRYELFNFGY